MPAPLGAMFRGRFQSRRDFAEQRGVVVVARDRRFDVVQALLEGTPGHRDRLDLEVGFAGSRGPFRQGVLLEGTPAGRVVEEQLARELEGRTHRPRPFGQSTGQFDGRGGGRHAPNPFGVQHGGVPLSRGWGCRPRRSKETVSSHVIWRQKKRPLDW